MKLRRIMAVILCLCVLISCVPALASAAEGEVDTALAEIVGQQVRAYADSIDQNKADEKAASVLAVHGITMGGRKLTVGEDNALTATLMNSELMQTALTNGCAEAIRYMQGVTWMERSYLGGNCSWYGTQDSEYQLFCYPSDEHTSENDDYTLEIRIMNLASCVPYDGARNSYDSALDWMAAGTYLSIQIDWVKTTAEETVYRVNCSVSDRFDFSTSSNSGFQNLISGMGAILFREFDWESTVSFELTVPYSCSHSAGAYRWTYDAENHIITSDSSEDYRENGTTTYFYENSSGETVYYYGLDETVRLYHDEPWVLEYDVKNAGSFALAPYESIGTQVPCLMNGSKTYVGVLKRERVLLTEEEMEAYGRESRIQHIANYYGTLLKARFAYSSNVTYTFRLENQVRDDGSNMIYLTVYNRDTGVIELDHVALDSHYYWESVNGSNPIYQRGEEYWTGGNDGVSGQDLFINYIGNKESPFSSGYFEMRIWENGEGLMSESHMKTAVIAPTCTRQGYTSHTCSICGYSYADTYIPATGHSYETEVIQPTCTDQGCTKYTCTTCGDSYGENYVDALGHSWSQWEVVKDATASESGQRKRSCETCGRTETEEIPARGFQYGDLNGDGKVNGLDVILLRQYIAGWKVTITLKAADANGDGRINGLDMILLRQYIAGWDVTLGPG